MVLEKCYLDNYDHAMALEKCYLDNYDHAMALEKCYLDNYDHAMALEKCYLDSIQVQRQVLMEDMEVMNQSLQYFQRQVLVEDMEVLHLQFAFLVTGRDLNPVLIAYECVKQNTACGEFHGIGDSEELQGDMNLQYLFSHIQHERGNAVPWFIPKKAEAMLFLGLYLKKQRQCCSLVYT